MKKQYPVKPKAVLGTMGAILLGLMFVAQLVGLAGGSLGDLPLAHAEEPVGSASLSPYEPYNPIPADGAINMPRSLSLKWQVNSLGWPGPFTYTVAFGAQNPPPVVVTSTNTASYKPGPLNDDTAYYWMVTADPGFVTVPGPTWVFTTARQISQTYTISPTGTTINTSDGALNVQLPPSSNLPSGATAIRYTSAPAVPNLSATALAFDLTLVDINGDPLSSPQTFTKNITVTVSYSQSLVDNLGLDEDLLDIYYYDDSSGKWRPVTVIGRDKNADTITFVIDHLTNFAVSAEQRVYLPVVMKN